MEEANKRINQILAMDEEDYTDEIIEEFVRTQRCEIPYSYGSG